MIKNLSFSTIKEFAISPANLLYYWATPSKTSPDIILGHVFEQLFLDESSFFSKYAVLRKADLPYPDKDYRNTENKAYREKFLILNENKEIIDEDTFETALAMCSAASEYAPSLRGEFRKSVKFSDFELFGVKFDGESDCIFDTLTLGMDIKKISNAHPDFLKYEILKRKWHWQAYIYRKAFNLNYFTFFAIEGKEPYNFLNLQLSELHYMLAEQELKVQCERYLKWNELGCPNLSYNFHLDNDRNFVLPFYGQLN